MVGDGERTDIWGWGEEVGGKVLRVQVHHLVGHLQGESLRHHGVEGEEIDGIVVAPVSRQRIGTLGEGIVGTSEWARMAHAVHPLVVEREGIGPGVCHTSGLGWG